MEFFRIRRAIPFMRHALVFNIISLVIFVASVGFLAVKHLHFSIEFTGGTVLEISYPQSFDPEQIRSTPEGRFGPDVRNLEGRAHPHAA